MTSASSSTRATSHQRRGVFLFAPLLLVAAAVLFASPASAACPFAGKASSSSPPPQHEAESQRQSQLEATARALLETDLTSELGLVPAVEERVFSSGGGASSLAEGVERLERDGGKKARRSRSRSLSGLNVSSIISEDDVILPDGALVAKILSKNATVQKNLVAGLANLTRSGAFRDMLVAELQALKDKPRWALTTGIDTLNATKAVFAYPSTAKTQGANSALAQQQKETVARAVFRVLAVPRDLGLLVRAAFHDAGTYNPSAVPPASQGGANGSLRKELAWGSNAGIVAIWPVVSTGHKILNAKFGNFSWADSIAVAGAAGVEKAGGPVISVGLGRPDSATADPKVGLATDPLTGINLTGDEAVAAWAEAGQSPETLATLMGAHTFGRSALTPLQGPLGPPSTFTNYFYKAVLAQKCAFRVDNALASQAQTAPFVEAYAADEALFFSQFARHYRAMTWWGVPNAPADVAV